MRDHHQQTEFLKHCLGYDESARCRELKQEISRIQRDEHCVQRAVWLMAILSALALAGLGYPAILLANFPYSAPQTIVNLVCVLGVASLASLLAFVILGMVYRKMLERRREESRQIVARLLESRLGNPHTTSWREGPNRPGNRGAAQASAGGDSSSEDGRRSAAGGQFHQLESVADRPAAGSGKIVRDEGAVAAGPVLLQILGGPRLKG